MQILVACTSGFLIGLSFYLGSKIVNKYLKVLENSQWKNFVTAVIGFIIMMVFLGLIMIILI
jgi:hypothetical protein